MDCSIISIGTELTLGLIINENSRYIAQRLNDIGIECKYMFTARDDVEEIIDVIEQGLKYSDIVIISGGLGPTDDDITRRAVSEVLKKRLVRDEKLDETSLKFKKRIKEKNITERLLRQSYIPDGSFPIKPKIGSASGFRAMLDNGRILFCIPGVPDEMKSMFEEDIVPFLRKKIEEEGQKQSGLILRKSTLLTTGISETRIEEKIKKIVSEARKVNVEVGITANPGLVKMILLAKARNISEADKNLKMIEDKISKKLGNYLYGKENELISDSLKEVIKKVNEKTGNKLTVSAAESITGGLISSMITDTPGSSEFFLGGIVSYSDFSKERLLNADRNILKQYGAVSRKICIEMAENAKEIFNSDYSVSVTGYAGPEAQDKSVGLVYCCIAGPEKYEKTYKKIFNGSRCEIKFGVAQFILNELRISISERYLKKG
jgi:nicotinamide-nucleotide amidase